MAIQFIHKPKGSVIGSGDLVFRHYGEEAPPLITFTVSGPKYVSGSPCTAEEGMTWGEWIESAYNELILKDTVLFSGSTTSGKCESIGGIVGYASRVGYKSTYIFGGTGSGTGQFNLTSDSIVDGAGYTADAEA